MNVTLAEACNWFGWQVLCEHGLERKVACPCSQAVPVLKWNCTFFNAIMSQGFYIEKELYSECNQDIFIIQPFNFSKCIIIYLSP